MILGRFKIYPVLDGYFRLDGGAMFGVIPKVLWQKTNPPDENNRILLALRCCLVKTPQDVILIDTGIGHKFQGKFEDIYQVKKEIYLEKSLKELGYKPADITIVINTHLHFDHCGGNTKLDDKGKIVPTFPNAKYYIQKAEWKLAKNPDSRSQASYLKENFEPLAQEKLVKLVDGDEKITDEIQVIKTSAHTNGHQVVLINCHGGSETTEKNPVNPVKRNSESLIYWGDLIPTSSHLSLPYLMSYDLFPLQTMEMKEKLLARALKENWVSFFEHDPKIAMAYLTLEDQRVKIKSVRE
jgi:glyoxylase-like metal-dependent hydrolase (beta-lactamase superfamily II)